MYLHVILEESKFPPLIRNLYETVSLGNHVYVIIGKSNELSGFKYLTTVGDFADLIGSRSDWQGVILHGMLASFEPYLDAVPLDLKLAWVVWGFEAYCYKYMSDKGLLELETNAFVFNSFSSRVKSFIRPMAWHLRGVFRRFRRVVNRINYVVTHLESEYKLFRDWGLISSNNVWHDAPVLLMSDLVPLSSCHYSGGRLDIQVGNSATPTNNHIDVFRRLATEDLTGRRVLVPLSYGDDDYRDFVVRRGSEILGDHFSPIVDFMLLEQYLKLFDRCGIVILNNYRQQAVGNVIAALWAGRSLYLGPSTVYQDYKSKGLPVFSFQSEFDLDRVAISRSNLSEVRDKLLDFVGDDAVVRKAACLLERLDS
tara:strand:- start:3750 stop:4853 length:1104 start_codon:yes stop_codon:yes gene_type:complete